MRQLLNRRVLGAAVAAILAGRSAVADQIDKTKPIDVAAVADKLDVFRDELGKVYVVAKASVGSKGFGDFARKYTFYGDGRTMYQQRIESTSTQNGNLSFGVWAPRARGIHHAQLEIRTDGTTQLTCNVDKQRKHERRTLTRVSDQDAKRVLASAKFRPPLWEHMVYFLGRGESTTYYLVDNLRDEFGGGGHRLYIGRKGQMKQFTITDLAEDSGGALVVAKAGSLEIKHDSAAWKLGKRTIEITKLPPRENRYLIFRELGVYGELGTVCEDQ